MSLYTQNGINENGNDRSQQSLHGCMWLTFVLDDKYHSVPRELAINHLSEFIFLNLILCVDSIAEFM